MTTSSVTLTFDNTSDANFRAWGSGISTALQAVGLVQTSDTGQINWTTVVRGSTSAAENIAGYEMYGFNDSLQGTQPIFLKLEYGHVIMTTNSGTAVPYLPVIYITVGTATNGAGKITAVVRNRVRLLGSSVLTSTSGSTSNGGAISASNQQCYFSGDGSYICMALGAQASLPTYNLSTGITAVASNLPCFFVIDRTRNGSGTITGHGAVTLTSYWQPTGATFVTGTTPTATCVMASFTGSGSGNSDTYWPISMPGQAFGTGSVSGDLYFWPLPMVSPTAEPQCLAVLGQYKTDVTLASTTSITVLGSSHTYLSLAGIGGTGAGSLASVNGSILSGAILMRYE